MPTLEAQVIRGEDFKKTKNKLNCFCVLYFENEQRRQETKIIPESNDPVWVKNETENDKTGYTSLLKLYSVDLNSDQANPTNLIVEVYTKEKNESFLIGRAVVPLFMLKKKWTSRWCVLTNGEDNNSTVKKKSSFLQKLTMRDNSSQLKRPSSAGNIFGSPLNLFRKKSTTSSPSNDQEEKLNRSKSGMRLLERNSSVRNPFAKSASVGNLLQTIKPEFLELYSESINDNMNIVSHEFLARFQNEKHPKKIITNGRILLRVRLATGNSNKKFPSEDAKKESGYDEVRGTGTVTNFLNNSGKLFSSSLPEIILEESMFVRKHGVWRRRYVVLLKSLREEKSAAKLYYFQDEASSIAFLHAFPEILTTSKMLPTTWKNKGELPFVTGDDYTGEKIGFGRILITSNSFFYLDDGVKISGLVKSKNNLEANESDENDDTVDSDLINAQNKFKLNIFGSSESVPNCRIFLHNEGKTCKLCAPKKSSLSKWVTTLYQLISSGFEEEVGMVKNNVDEHVLGTKSALSKQTNDIVSKSQLINQTEKVPPILDVMLKSPGKNKNVTEQQESPNLSVGSRRKSVHRRRSSSSSTLPDSPSLPLVNLKVKVNADKVDNISEDKNEESTGGLDHLYSTVCEEINRCLYLGGESVILEGILKVSLKQSEQSVSNKSRNAFVILTNKKLIWSFREGFSFNDYQQNMKEKYSYDSKSYCQYNSIPLDDISIVKICGDTSCKFLVVKDKDMAKNDGSKKLRNLLGYDKKEVEESKAIHFYAFDQQKPNKMWVKEIKMAKCRMTLTTDLFRSVLCLDHEKVKKTINKGKEYNIWREDEGNNALNCAFIYCIINKSSTKKQKSDILTLRLEKHLTIKHEEKENMDNAKEEARFLEVIKAIKQETPNILEKRLPNGDYPLHMILRRDLFPFSEQLFDLLLEDCAPGVAFLQSEYKGKMETVLHVACYWRCIHAVKGLLQLNTTVVGVLDKSGQLPLHCTLQPLPLCQATSQPNSDLESITFNLVKLLLDTKCCDGHLMIHNAITGDNPVTYACKLGNHSVIELFLQQQHDCMRTSNLQDKNTPLHLVCELFNRATKAGDTKQINKCWRLIMLTGGHYPHCIPNAFGKTPLQLIDDMESQYTVAKHLNLDIGNTSCHNSGQEKHETKTTDTFNAKSIEIKNKEQEKTVPEFDFCKIPAPISNEVDIPNSMNSSLISLFCCQGRKKGHVEKDEKVLQAQNSNLITPKQGKETRTKTIDKSRSNSKFKESKKIEYKIL